MLASTDDAQVVCDVPLVKFDPAANQNLTQSDAPLSLPNVPVVSAGNVSVYLFQLPFDTVYCLTTVLVLSKSLNSQV